ncbi:hypothetical protein PCANC_19914 [Puccinia coronata f. sp. avenae]|uniref:Uncharacterized protein n=1 Tax=Puccinia coronata f. sp. avenae TaxID=200324 RepID=A0A2N5U356_9BASI|nr:hypothetical protein PCANC_19914 [Puccinia coronata f. sp. avenae]
MSCVERKICLGNGPKGGIGWNACDPAKPQAMEHWLHWSSFRDHARKLARDKMQKIADLASATPLAEDLQHLCQQQFHNHLKQLNLSPSEHPDPSSFFALETLRINHLPEPAPHPTPGQVLTACDHLRDERLVEVGVALDDQDAFPDPSQDVDDAMIDAAEYVKETCARSQATSHEFRMQNTLGRVDGRPCSSSQTGKHSQHDNNYFSVPVLQWGTGGAGIPVRECPQQSERDGGSILQRLGSWPPGHGGTGMADTPATASSSSRRRRRTLLGLLPSSARLMACHSLLAILFSLLVPAQLLSISASFYAVPFLLRLSPGNALDRFILSIAFLLAGLLVPPYLGTRSDLQLTHCRTSSIPLATSVAILALLALSLCQPIALLLLYILLLDLGDWDPQRKMDITSTSMLIGTLALYALALALNAIIQSAHSILLDQFPSQQQPRINMHITRLLRLADLLVFLVVVSSSHGDLDGAPNEPDPHLLRKLVALAAPVLVMNSLITTHLYPLEPPPFHTHASSMTDTSSSRLQAQVQIFRHTLVLLPVPLKRVCGLEMLSATCWLTILYHAKPLLSFSATISPPTCSPQLERSSWWHSVKRVEDDDYLLNCSEFNIGTTPCLLLGISSLVASILHGLDPWPASTSIFPTPILLHLI